MDDPLVTVAVLCRNEERFIGRCLEGILANDYPRDRLEVLIVDGMSTDGTRGILEEYARRYAGMRLLDNPKRTIPAGMNLAFTRARGAFILKMDAHSTCPPTYIRDCVRHALASGADNVGGVAQIEPGAPTRTARAIAGALAHPFGSGPAHVKVGARAPLWADTALFGCYRRGVFDTVGPWNEALAGSSDLDFNARLRAAGGRILLVPDIVVRYHADPGLRSFWRHNFADGVWATYVLKFRSRGWSWRHWVPLGFLAGLATLGLVGLIWPPGRGLLAATVVLYLLANLVSSLHVALRAADPLLLPSVLLAFAIRHLAHGLGAAWGILLLMLPGVQWQGRRGRFA